MEIVLSVVALATGILLFIGANLVAIVLMVGPERPVPAARKPHR